jgi:hypothetical protein
MHRHEPNGETDWDATQVKTISGPEEPERGNGDPDAGVARTHLLRLENVYAHMSTNLTKALGRAGNGAAGVEEAQWPCPKPRAIGPSHRGTQPKM